MVIELSPSAQPVHSQICWLQFKNEAVAALKRQEDVFYKNQRAIKDPKEAQKVPSKTY